MKRVVCIFATVLAVAACSKSDDTAAPSTTTNPVAAGITAVNTALKNIDELMVDDPSVVAASTDVLHPMAAGSIALIWDGTPWMNDPRCSGSGGHCGGVVGLKKYFSFALDSSAVRDNGSDLNVFGRIKSALSQACAFSALLTGADGTLPTAGSKSLVLDPTNINFLVTSCGMSASSLAGVAGQTITVTVSETTDTTLYDRKYVTSMGSTQTSYIRVNANVVNILSGEVNGSTYTRTSIVLDRATGSVRAEYLSRDGTGGGEMHRAHYDATTNLGSVVGSSFNAAVGFYIVHTIVGKPGVANGEVAIGAGMKDYQVVTADTTATDSDFNHYTACVNQTTGAIVTPNTLSCAGGITGTGTSGSLATVFTNMVTSLSASGAGIVGTNAMGETRTVPFTTGAGVFTTAIPVGP